jgi:signal transduction histidine kinase
MYEVEITEMPPLEPGQQSLLDMHSVLNVLNVLRGELAVLGLTLAGDAELLRPALACCDDLTSGLSDPAASFTMARELERHEAEILTEIDREIDRRLGARGSPEIAESLANVHSVFAIMRVRARELLARASQPDRWETYPLGELRRNFLDVFAAIERNAKGRYRITYNAALQRPADYYFDFRLESASGDRIQMPPVFQDVLRDLIANARKYTAPGGRITAALYEDAEALRLVVEDTGRGIPQDELPAVVQFGKRASNVADVRTMGGGFGLTKAFFATKQFGGRFWIASQLGAGTRVRIELPLPRVPAAV